MRNEDGIHVLKELTANFLNLPLKVFQLKIFLYMCALRNLKLAVLFKEVRESTRAEVLGDLLRKAEYNHVVCKLMFIFISLCNLELDNIVEEICLK